MINFLSFSDEFNKIAAHWLAEAEQALAHKVMKTPGAIAKATSPARKDVFRVMDQSAKMVPGKTVTKVGSVGEKAMHALDLGGLAALAAPTVQKMRGKPMSDKNKDRAELGGLAALAIPVARHMLKKGSAKISMPIGTAAAGALNAASQAAKKMTPKAVAMTAAQRAAKVEANTARAVSFHNTGPSSAPHLPVVQGKLL